MDVVFNMRRSFIYQAKNEQETDVCLQVRVFHSFRWSQFQIHVRTLLQLIITLDQTSKFIFSSFPGLGESKYSGDCLLFWTLLYSVKRQWIFSIHRYRREFLHLHRYYVSDGETDISELNRPWKEVQRPYFEPVSGTEKWPPRLGKVTCLRTKNGPEHCIVERWHSVSSYCYSNCDKASPPSLFFWFLSIKSNLLITHICVLAKLRPCGLLPPLLRAISLSDTRSEVYLLSEVTQRGMTSCSQECNVYCDDATCLRQCASEPLKLRQFISQGSIKPLSPVVTICTTRFNIRQFYVLPTQCMYVFCVDLRTKSDYFPIQRELAGFYNRDVVCLLRGTDWNFKDNLG